MATNKNHSEEAGHLQDEMPENSGKVDQWDTIRNEIIRGRVVATLVQPHLEQQRIRFLVIFCGCLQISQLRAYTNRHSGWRVRLKPKRCRSDSIADTLGAHKMTINHVNRPGKSKVKCLKVKKRKTRIIYQNLNWFWEIQKITDVPVH